MPTFIKTGYWEKIQKGYNGWLNLDNLIASSVGTGAPGQIAYFGTSGLSGSSNFTFDAVNGILSLKNAVGDTMYLGSTQSVAQYGLQGTILFGSTIGAAYNDTSEIRAYYTGTGANRSGKMVIVTRTLGGGVAAVNFGENGEIYSRTSAIPNTYPAKLYIAGLDTLATGWTAQFHNSTQTSNSLMINNDGSVLIGTATVSGYKLDVNGTARVQGTFVATGTSYISSISTIGTYSPFSTFNVVNDGPASIACDRFSTNATPPHFNLRKSRGTSAAPTVVVTNDELGYVGFWGHDGTAFQRVGIIYVRAASVTGSTITPTMQFGVGTSAAANQYYITIYNSGNVAFGSGAPEELSAQISIASTTKGFLPPRMTSAQKTAIATPATGLVVYDTTLNKLCVYTGAAWQTVSSA